MAIPLVFFVALFLAAAFFIILGLVLDAEKGIAFFMFGGVLFLVLGAFLYSGVQLDTVASISGMDTGTATINYEVANVTNDSPLWVLFWACIAVGVILPLVSLQRIMSIRRENTEIATWDV